MSSRIHFNGSGYDVKVKAVDPNMIKIKYEAFVSESFPQQSETVFTGKLIKFGTMNVQHDKTLGDTILSVAKACSAEAKDVIVLCRHWCWTQPHKFAKSLGQLHTNQPLSRIFVIHRQCAEGQLYFMIRPPANSPQHGLRSQEYFDILFDDTTLNQALFAALPNLLPKFPIVLIDMIALYLIPDGHCYEEKRLDVPKRGKQHEFSSAGNPNVKYKAFSLFQAKSMERGILEQHLKKGMPTKADYTKTFRSIGVRRGMPSRHALDIVMGSHRGPHRTMRSDSG